MAGPVKPPDALLKAIRDHKVEILALLKRPHSRRDISITAAQQVVLNTHALASLLKEADTFMFDFIRPYNLERVDGEYLHLNHVAATLANTYGQQIVLDYGRLVGGVGDPPIVGWHLRPVKLPPTPVATQCMETEEMTNSVASVSPKHTLFAAPTRR